MAQMNDYTPSEAEVCVDNICCTPACREKVKGSKEQADSLVMQLQFTRSNDYETKKKLNGYKDMVEVQKRGIRKLHNDMSEAQCRYLHFKELSEKLIIELDSLKSTFENMEFNFKKFDVFSEKVEKMINQQLKYNKKEVRNKGLGFVCIPPPYSHNYSSYPMTKEEIDNLPKMEYGKPGDKTVEPTKSRKIKITRPDKTEIILEKQAYQKTFVKPESVSNHTETLIFENNVNIDKHFQVLVNPESCFSQSSPKVQPQTQESEVKLDNIEFAMMKGLDDFMKGFGNGKLSESTSSCDSTCDASETTTCEKSEMVESVEVNDGSPEEAKSPQTKIESDKLIESSISSYSTCDSSEKADCEKSESVNSVESTNESSETVESELINEESESTSGASVESNGKETTEALLDFQMKIVVILLNQRCH
ncbi:hypothetical protein Hanom_Chr12g01130191 [Helianthus anomalus]